MDTTHPGVGLAPAIGTYASAGAALGPSFLWAAPATFPMMFAVLSLSSKLGQTSGKGLFANIRFSATAGLVVTWFI